MRCRSVIRASSQRGSAPQHVDDLRRQCDLPIPLVSSTLAMLELKGLIRQAGAMQYVRTREEREEYTVSMHDSSCCAGENC